MSPITRATAVCASLRCAIPSAPGVCISLLTRASSDGRTTFIPSEPGLRQQHKHTHARARGTHVCSSRLTEGRSERLRTDARPNNANEIDARYAATTLNTRHAPIRYLSSIEFACALGQQRLLVGGGRIGAHALSVVE
jgi:hypothetical protein